MSHARKTGTKFRYLIIITTTLNMNIVLAKSYYINFRIIIQNIFYHLTKLTKREKKEIKPLK